MRRVVVREAVAAAVAAVVGKGYSMRVEAV